MTRHGFDGCSELSSTGQVKTNINDNYDDLVEYDTCEFCVKCRASFVSRSARVTSSCEDDLLDFDDVCCEPRTLPRFVPITCSASAYDLVQPVDLVKLKSKKVRFSEQVDIHWFNFTSEISYALVGIFGVHAIASLMTQNPLVF